MIKLSIIIPAYNAEPYLGELINCLSKQVTDEVEVIVIDDGSKDKVISKAEYISKWLNIYRQKNKGAGIARNRGIDKAKGEYIAFIDADDLVPDYYIQKILEKIDKTPFDVCDLSWRSLTRQGLQADRRLRSENDWLTNPSACTRIFRRGFIGEVRFSEKKDSTEDEDFSRRLGYLFKDTGIKHTVITDYMYFYRTDVTDSKSKKFKQGLKKTKRVTYYYNQVTKDMTWLIDQIKKEDEENEVWLLTNQNDLPELRRWCQIYKPYHTWTHYLRGETYHNIDIIPVPHNTQVVLYINSLNKIGGLGTFVYNFCSLMKDHYDITYVVNQAADEHVERINKLVKVIRNEPHRQIVCDTLIMLRVLDKVPVNIKYKKSVQMCHCCKTTPSLHIPQGLDYIVNVSETSKKSFGREAEKARVIHNLIDKYDKKPLVLMSATRIPAPDKGDNEKRMLKLANMLEEAGIDYIWLNFSDGQLIDAPKNFINVGSIQNAARFFKMATYVVQCSNSEAWSYTVLEALTQNVPVLVCPFPSAFEMGIKDGVSGYVLPFDMDFDVNKLTTVPEFNYEYDNDKIIDEWKRILNAKPKRTRRGGMVRVVVEKPYRDMELNKCLSRGYMTQMIEARARDLQAKGLIKIIGEV